MLVKILNGYLQPDGLHINGALDVNFPGKLVFADQMFNELIVPADMQMMTASGNPDGHYGTAIFDQPLLVRFHDDFDMEIRSYSMLSAATPIQIGQLAPLHQEGLTRTLKFAGQDCDGNTDGASLPDGPDLVGRPAACRQPDAEHQRGL